MLRIIIYSVFFLISINISVADNSYLCPQSIAAISDDPLSHKGSKILSKMYTALGCPIEIVFLPGRRGISYFNQKKVDGELYRLNLIEAAYSNKFTRSSSPLFEIINAVWARPDLTDIKLEPIGYVIGIAWHENFIKNANENIPFRRAKFDSEEDMLLAYNNGKIGSFLSEAQSISLLSSQNKYKVIPRKSFDVEALPLFHYLQAKYTPFMKEFSKYLQEHQPFAGM